MAHQVDTDSNHTQQVRKEEMAKGQSDNAGETLNEARMMEDRAHKEAQKVAKEDAERLYAERMEDEYAKREGGA